MKYISSLILLLTASLGMAQNVPNTFSSGAPALASEVNENFADLDGRVNTNTADGAALAAVVDNVIADITIEESVFTEADFLAVSSCPADTVAISANCACDGDGTTTNFGVLTLCASGDDGVGQSAAAFCDIDFTFDETLAPPTAQVSAVCVGATKVDGTVVSSTVLTKPSALRKLSGLPTSLQTQIEDAQARAEARGALLAR